MTIVLDKPEQINMWVLLSRRHQVQLHLKGLKVKGLVAALKREFPDQGIRTAKDAIVPIEYAISMAGGEVDYRLVNIHLMRKSSPDSEFFVDAGILATPEDITDPRFRENYDAGLIELVFTLEAPRNPNGLVYTAA